MNTPNLVITPAMFQIGDQVDQFQIKDQIAQGGMSSVFHAFDLIEHRDVVLKIPDKALIGDPAQFERFQREIDISKQLNHPAILRGIHAGKYNRVPYLVTEMIHGITLRHLITQLAPLPVEKAMGLVRKIAEGMTYCHQNGVIHRDLKPENILIDQDELPVIMDFGLALTRTAHRVTYSNLSVTMGTPDYMSPEQIEGQRGDARSDIYALGIILFEMLSGNTPFSGDTNLAVMAQHINTDAPRLDQLNPDVPKPVAAIVAKALQRDPSTRYQDMQSLIENIDQPEKIDLTILEKTESTRRGLKRLYSNAFRYIVIAGTILVVIVILALILQRMR